MPTRTCIGCRKKFEQSNLIRYVKINNSLKEATLPRLDGRGYYLCNDICKIKASKNNKYKGILNV